MAEEKADQVAPIVILLPVVVDATITAGGVYSITQATANVVDEWCDHAAEIKDKRGYHHRCRYNHNRTQIEICGVPVDIDRNIDIKNTLRKCTLIHTDRTIDTGTKDKRSSAANTTK